MKETIIFKNATGKFPIDFAEKDRIDKFGNNFTIDAYNVEGKTETKIIGFSEQRISFGSLITMVVLDGISKNGYILITGKNEK